MQRLYRMAALVALFHMLALGGVVGFLVVTGRLTPEHVEQIAAVLRNSEPAPGGADPSATTTAPASQPRDAGLPRATAERIRRIRDDEEIIRRLLERQIEELGQAHALVETATLDVIQRQEKLEARRKEFAAQQKARAEASHTAGMKTQLDLLGSLRPKQARDMLIKRRSDAEVARILSALPKRTAQRILDACKTQAELEWADRMLKLIGRTNEPASETPAG